MGSASLGSTREYRPDHCAGWHGTYRMAAVAVIRPPTSAIIDNFKARGKALNDCLATPPV
ncbi:MAG: hypothetical protein ACXV7G_06690 [Halobacteriota archaeon]